MENATNRLEALFELADLLGQQQDFEEVLRIISTTASNLLNAQISSVVVINPDTRNTVKTIVREGGDASGRALGLLQTNIVGWCMHNKTAFLSNNLQADARFSKSVAAKFPAKSAIAAALTVHGKDIGYLLAIEKGRKATYNDQDLTILEKMASIVAPFLDNTRKIQALFEKQLPDTALISKYEALGMLGKSPAYVELLKSIEAAAQCDVRVQLQGRSGTGKEKIARAIHQFSKRANAPFVAIDCGAIPENLIESELFGHVKGAFTGANSNRRGLIEEANGGTMFMDEVANLPYDVQAKLLRVLQENEIRPLGSNNTKRIDVRIICASSSSLRTMVDAGTFREDLFYRLHVYPIEVPSLKQRQSDIPLLANHFLGIFAKQQGKQTEGFYNLLTDYMQLRDWPGNIRELENFVERLLTLTPATSTTIEPELLPREFQKEYKDLTFSADAHPIRKSLQETLDETEEDLIRLALKQHNWNQSKAARALQISERAIRYKMEKLGIEKPAE